MTVTRLTEQALRGLNSPDALAHCELVALLPRTLATIRADADQPADREPTPLEVAHALRQVMVAAIERLKPVDGDCRLGSPAALAFNILREEYVQGLPNRQIMTRHSVSESTFHRHRRQAIQILAEHLRAHEEQLASTPAVRVAGHFLPCPADWPAVTYLRYPRPRAQASARQTTRRARDYGAPRNQSRGGCRPRRSNWYA